jgi:curved DNA-binding protein CbpA
LYDVLQVSPWCEPEVIQAAYRALARIRHPDVNRDPDAEDQMRRLNVAYQTLSDPTRRMRYDEELTLEAARPISARPAPAPVDPSGSWTPPPPTPIRPRASAAPASGGAATGPAASPASAYQTTSAYQPTIFDAGGNMLLPRSAIYVSLVMVTVILALVAWLILDALSQRPSVAPRFQPGVERSGHRTATAASLRSDERLAAVASITTSAEAVAASAEPSTASASDADDALIDAAGLFEQRADERAMTAQPGLSPLGTRWNQ